MANSKTDDSILPAFHLEARYPDPKAIFADPLPSLDEIKDQAIIVLDTNVLLVPYTVQAKSLAEIEKCYTGLVESNRLFIPSHVVREFAKNRGEKIANIYSQIHRKQSVDLGASFTLLESESQYRNLLDVEKQLEEKLVEYRKAIKEVLGLMRSWRWDDPVTRLYRKVFSPTTIVDLGQGPELIEKDLARRLENQIPPGYMDANKPDSGVGDVIVWNTILELADAHKKPMIFVTGDEKSDWMLRSENTALFPRFELIEEYMRASEGKAFHIVKFSELLDLFGVEQTIVEEVKKEEHQWGQIFPTVTQNALQSEHSGLSELIAAILVKRWWNDTYPSIKIVDGTRFPDFIVSYEGGSRMGVEVLVTTRTRLSRVLSKAIAHASTVEGKIADGEIDTMAYVFVCASKIDALDSISMVSARLSSLHRTAHVIGFIEEGEFVSLVANFV